MSSLFSNVAPLRVDFDKELLLQKMTKALYGLSDAALPLKKARIVAYWLHDFDMKYDDRLDEEALRIERIRRKSVGIGK